MHKVKQKQLLWESNQTK